MKIKSLILVILISIMSLQISYANPFGNNSISDQKIEKTEPSFVTKTWFKFMQIQKEYTRKIPEYINDIKNNKNSNTFWLLMGISLIYGVLHAIGPGHGKLLIMSYFTCCDAKWWRGVLMGFQIAFMHVISAILLVFFTDGIARHVFASNPSLEMNVIQIISYSSIVIISLFMMRRIYINNTEAKKQEIEKGRSAKSQWILALSIGLAPCGGALLFLFYAMSKDMLITGIMIVLSMALGIAITLSIIGVLCVVAKKNVSLHIKENRRRKFSHIFNYIGAFLIFLIGASLLINVILKI